MLVAELGVRVEELVAGVILGLLIMFCCVVSTTALGAAANQRRSNVKRQQCEGGGIRSGAG
jgi:Na+/H+-translocating membrane pyrophosphatase